MHGSIILFVIIIMYVHTETCMKMCKGSGGIEKGDLDRERKRVFFIIIILILREKKREKLNMRAFVVSGNHEGNCGR